VLITDEEIIKEYDQFKMTVGAVDLDTRRRVWTAQFVFISSALIAAYASIYITVYYAESEDDSKIYFISNLDLQNYLLFVAFLCGVQNGQTTLLTDNKDLI
jgi:hypothetical protein